jgi:acyl dehydratase
MSTLLNIGDQYRETFIFTQEQVNAFAALSGDNNPIHSDLEYAAQTPFKKPIVHGIFVLSVFSKMIGMTFPGEGTVYMHQDVGFKRPVFPGEEYEAVVTIAEINRERHTAVVATEIRNLATGKISVEGKAQIMHKEKF